MTLIDNALSGSLAAKAALSAAGQNIANVATAGYTRQQALLVTAAASASGTRTAGNGVTVSSLIRFSDSYTSQQMWRAAANLGRYDVAQPYLTQVEQVMGDDTANLSNGLDDFFSALNAVSVDPTSTPLREQVITSAQSLAQRFDNLNGVMADQLVSLNQQRSATVDQINSLSSDVAALNQQIASAKASGVNTSALVDARDQKTDALAKLVGIQVIDQPDGSRSVSLASGQPLVSLARAATLTAQGQNNGSQTLTLTFAHESFTIGTAGMSGQLGGLNAYEQTVLSPLKQSIANMAGQFASAVNTTLAGGFGTGGAAGGPLFVFNAGGGSSMLTVDASVQASTLGFSSNASKPGNSDNLQTLIGLDRLPVTLASLGTAPVLLSDANVQLLGNLGTASQRNQASLATAQTVREQSETNWRSISGVNSDEEAINLVTYQQMYQANMKVIAVAGALFDATIAMMD